MDRLVTVLLPTGMMVNYMYDPTEQDSLKELFQLSGGNIPRAESVSDLLK